MWRQIFLYAGIFLIGAVAGSYFIPDTILPRVSESTDEQEMETKYSYINPLLFCKDQNLSNLNSEVSTEIEKKVGTYIEERKKEGGLIEASVYYKDLNSGPWALINGELLSAPSSLLKVPLAISVYSAAEKNPSLLGTSVHFSGGEDVPASQYFKPPQQIVAGSNYTAEELVRYMVEDSDNAALYLLSNMLDQKDLLDSYSHLGITTPTTNLSSYSMTVRQYASFFRILFNASYLSQDKSEYLLSLLASSKFDQGIEAGLPKDIKVANKFGETRFSNNKVQLHDCGIVYYKKGPYLLCIMTHGTNFDALAGSIAGISKIIYAVLEEQN